MIENIKYRNILIHVYMHIHVCMFVVYTMYVYTHTYTFKSMYNGATLDLSGTGTYQ